MSIINSFGPRRATLTIAESKKLVRNSDVKKLAKDLKYLKNQIDDRLLGKAQGIGRGVPMEPKTAKIRMKEYLTSVDSMKDKLKRTTYRHNPRKVNALDKLKHDAVQYMKASLNQRNLQDLNAKRYEVGKKIDRDMQFERRHAAQQDPDAN
ncbi:hypothetical protein ACJ51O_35575 (plasmid) [Burkholderia pyrrocinia]|uniref:hypothetical protein n=1 Tax=Burkholderia pyrrocinia TaxID=60550 RepID=UPI0038B45DA6